MEIIDAKNNCDEDIFECLKRILARFDTALEDNDLDRAVWVYQILHSYAKQHESFRLTTAQLAILKEVYNTPATVHKPKTIYEAMWIPLMSFTRIQRKPLPLEFTKEIAQHRSNIISYLYDIVCTRKQEPVTKALARDGSSNLMFMHAIYTCCRWQEIEKTWYEDYFKVHKAREYEELYGIIAATSYSGKLITPKNLIIEAERLAIGMPIYAIDKHTKQGEKKESRFKVFC